MTIDAEPVETARDAARAPGAGGYPAHGRGVRRALGWLAFAVALGLTFSLYLRPGLVLDFGMVLEMCGLR